MAVPEVKQKTITIVPKTGQEEEYKSMYGALSEIAAEKRRSLLQQCMAVLLGYVAAYAAARALDKVQRRKTILTAEQLLDW